MDKRRITAREILKDIRGGATDSDLMKKYTLSAQGLQSVFTKLVNSKVVTQAELDDRVPISERTVDLGLFICPACGNIQGKEFVTCPRCGFTVPQRSRQSAATTEVRDRKPATKIVAKVPKVKAAPDAQEEYKARTGGLAEDSIRDLGRTANYCRILGIVVLVVYVLIVAGMFAIMQILGQGISLSTVEFLAVALMGVPALAVAFILFIVLKALAESVTVFINVANSLSKNRPPA